MNNTFFSIIIPTYNRSNIIEKTIESVLAQSFSDWELIVVDDGSTDDTALSVKKFKDPRVQYIYQENKESSAARNLGISKAQGQYICFLDSDDSFSKDHLKGFYEAIQSNPSKTNHFYFCGVTICNEHEGQPPTLYSFTKKVTPSFFAQGSVIPGQVCIARQILEKINFDEQIVIVEDTDLWVRISSHYPCVYVHQASINYNFHEGNSVNVKNNAYLTRLNGLKRTFDKPEGRSIDKMIRQKVLSDCYFGIFKFHMNKNEVTKARISIFTAILKYPSIRLKEKLYLLIYPKRTV